MRWRMVSSRSGSDSRSGPNPTVLYLPRDEKGFAMTKLTHYFKNTGVVREHLLKYSGDPVVRQLAERRLERAKANSQKKWTAPEALENAERGRSWTR